MQIEKYLKTFDAVTKDPSLEAMQFFMNEFDNPHKKTKFIHVAGTNGKGSVCEMLNNVLIKAGYKVGKYISPHLIKYNERITVNNIEITDSEISEILEKIDEKVKKYNSTHETKVKEFEVVTTLALIYFAKKQCNFVVLETGLGGIDDCTNIADGIISIITDIGYDHMDILGKTIQEITEKKAGIIKENNDTIMYYQEKVTEIIKNTCNKKNNTLHIINEEDIQNYRFDTEYQKIDYKKYKDICINLKGKCQIYNTSLVLECIDILKQKGYEIKEEAVKEGIKTVVHKARFENLKDKPRIIFDGGHNENAANNFINTVNMYYPKEQKIYIVSLLKTKDYKKVIEILTKDKKGIFIFTTGNDSKRYVNKEELYNEAKKYLNNNIYKEELKDAINISKNKYKECIIFIVRKFLYI